MAGAYTAQMPGVVSLVSANPIANELFINVLSLYLCRFRHRALPNVRVSRQSTQLQIC